MADIRHEIELIFEGVDQVSDTLTGIGSGLQSFGSGMTDVLTPVANVTKGVLAMDAAVNTVVIGGMALAIKESKKFAAGMMEINTMAELSDEGLKTFGDDILAYGQDSSKTFEDIQNSIYNAISMGADYADSLAVLKDAEKLAVGGKAELNDTLELLMGTMNTYGASTDEAGRYSDMFFTIVKDGKTTIPELAASMSDVTGIASAGKVPMDILGAAIAAITATGAPTASAITRIKAAIEGIINPTTQAKDAAAAMGVELSASALESKGLDGIMRELNTATGGSVEKMTALFSSSEALQAALVLSADKSGSFKTALDDMAKSSGATDKAFQEMASNSENSMQKMQNAAKAALTKVGDRIDSLQEALTGPLSEGFKSISKAVDDGTFNPIFDAVEKFSKDMDEYLSGIAKAMPEAFENIKFDELIKSYETIGGAIGDLFDVDLTKPEDLREVIDTIVGTIIGFNNVVGGTIQSMGPLVDMVTDSVKWFASLDGETQKVMGGMGGLALQGLALAAGLKTAGTAASGLGSILSSASGLGATRMGGYINGVQSLAGKAGLLGLAGAVGVSAGTLINKYVPGVAEAAQWTWKMVDAVVDFTGTEGGQTFKNMGTQAEKTERQFNAFLERMKETKKATDDLPDSKTIKITATEDVVEKVETASDALDDIPGEIKTDLKINATEASKIDQVGNQINELPGTKSIVVGADVDTESFEALENAVITVLPSGEKKIVFKAEAKTDEAKEKIKELQDQVPDKEVMEIQAKLDIANLESQTELAKIEAEKISEMVKYQAELDISRIEAQAESFQAAVEWKAKLDIADIEANADIITAQFESISAGIDSTGDSILALFETLTQEDISIGDRMMLQNQIQTEIDLRKQEFDLQKQILEQQLRLDAAKEARLASGEALFTMQMDGRFQPGLEMLAEEFVQYIQIKVTEEGQGELLNNV